MKKYLPLIFTNASDVYRATLTSGDGKHVIILKDENTDKLVNGVYKITDEDNIISRVYTLNAEDANGNSIIPIRFKLPPVNVD